MAIEGFPLGLRFALAEQSGQAKRDCWKRALRFAFCVEFAGAKLYELSLPDEDCYICILGAHNITQGRGLTRLLRRDETLKTQLTPVNPIVQQNRLESFESLFVSLGTVGERGHIERTEAGLELLPESVPPVASKPRNHNILIAAHGAYGRSPYRMLELCGDAAMEKTDRHLQLFPLFEDADGLMEAVVGWRRGRFLSCTAHDADLNPILAHYGVLPNRKVVIEAAAIAGRNRSHQKPVELLSSFGVGELIAHALNAGYTDISLLIGDTLCFDCGVGLLSALGFRFYDEEGNETTRLSSVCSFDVNGRNPKLGAASIKAYCSRTLPLSGKNGAVEQMLELPGEPEESLRRIAEGAGRLAAVHPYKAEQAGAGSGGGIGYACSAFLQAEVKDMSNFVLEEGGLVQAVKLSRYTVLIYDGLSGEGLREDGLLARIVGLCRELKKTVYVAAAEFSPEALDYFSSHRGVLKHIRLPKEEGEVSDFLRTAFGSIAD
ncbi:MAG: glycerate kinase [Clostridia bacterium]|nr:glycerate kinase [Clostridia bacterium]